MYLDGIRVSLEGSACDSGAGQACSECIYSIYGWGVLDPDDNVKLHTRRITADSCIFMDALILCFDLWI